MARKKKSVEELKSIIKVRLDSRTIITLKDMSKLTFWKKQYPNLEVLTR